MSGQQFPILACSPSDEKGFIRFWAEQYLDKNELMYQRNIGRLTPTAVRELFLWKNGGRLTGKMERSVKQNYVARLPQLKRLPLDLDPGQFFQTFSRGGAIWRVFFLHIWQPRKYPIFDQHVYRAMCFLKTSKLAEIPPQDGKKLSIYINEYLPFFGSFAHRRDRRVDKALWSFGRFLKSQFHAMVTDPELASSR